MTSLKKCCASGCPKPATGEDGHHCAEHQHERCAHSDLDHKLIACLEDMKVQFETGATASRNSNLGATASRNLTLGPHTVRQFETGATRDLDADKLDYEGFLSPIVLERFAEYMNKHRQTAAGVRDSDNWQKGIPVPVYMKSLLRHVMTVWLARRRGQSLPEEELCAILFNVQGLLLETLRAKE